MTDSAGAGAAPAGEPRPVEIVAVGAATPTRRLAVKEITTVWGGGGRGTLAVCDADEDTLTLAWEAAVAALDAAHLDAAALSGLWWGTARPPFAEGPSLAFLASALGLPAEAGGALSAGSTHAGMDALLAAWDALAAGHASVALVVASDALIPGPGTAGETVTGAGAVAYVLRGVGSGPGGSPAPDPGSGATRLTTRARRRMAVVDRYRGDDQAATGDIYDGRLFREDVYLPLLTDTGRGLGTPVSGWAVSDPDGKLAAALGRRLGAPITSTPVQAAIGDTGAAAPLLGLAHALGAGGGADTPAGTALGVLAYGGGMATAVAVVPGAPVPGAERIAAVLEGGWPVDYTDTLKARNQLVAMSDPIPMGVPPGSAAFVRGAEEMLGLEGARCAACGVVSTPPSIHPTCTGCGGTDLTIIRLARAGTIQTFVVNQTMPPPFQAPLPMVVIDLVDGARVMLQGTSEDAAVMAIGDRVELHLRRYAVERGVPVYGYKAVRRGDDSGAGAGTAGKETS